MVVPCQLVVPVWSPEGVSGVGGLRSPEGMSWIGGSFLHCKGPPWEPRTSAFYDVVLFKRESWRRVLEGINVWCGENPLEDEI